MVLEETTNGFEHSFGRLETTIKAVMPSLTDPSARETGRMTALSRMLPLENALSSLRLRVRRVNAILEQVRACGWVGGWVCVRVCVRPPRGLSLTRVLAPSLATRVFAGVAPPPPWLVCARPGSSQLLESTDDIEGLCVLSAGKGAGRGGDNGGGGGCCSEAEYALTEIAIEAYSSRLEFLGDEVRRARVGRAADAQAD